MTYNSIIDPKTNKYISINSYLGKYVLKKYIFAHNNTTKNIIHENPQITKYQIFSDIDDTLHPSNYGIFSKIAGTDIYMSGKYYPGVKELHRAFYKKYKLPSVIVTANPLKKSNIITRHFITNKIKTLTNLLHGTNVTQNVVYYAGDYFKSSFDTAISVTNNLYNIFFKETTINDNLFKNMADCKFNQIREHILKEIEIGKQYGYTYKAIWIGDNGKGDLYTAIKLIKNNLIDVAFIHYVDPFKKSGEEYDEIKLDSTGQFRSNIIPFITYSDIFNFLIKDINLIWLENIDLEKFKY